MLRIFGSVLLFVLLCRCMCGLVLVQLSAMAEPRSLELSPRAERPVFDVVVGYTSVRTWPGP